MKPLALDLFAGAGGASYGLYLAGFDVIGVDICPQPRYPAFHNAQHAKHFTFVQADSLRLPFDLSQFDFIWASPPCQAYSAATRAQRARGKTYPDLIAPVRRLLRQSGNLYAIENVIGAPMGWAIMLCGKMFGLRVQRHRIFETSWLMFQPWHDVHTTKTANRNRRAAWAAGGDMCVTGDIGTWMGKAAMGIDWMTGNELSQAIPPAYAEFIGRAAIKALDTKG